MHRTLIVTPTYDEASNLARFVAFVRAAAPEADLLIVDDNSPDGTGDIADRLAAEDANVRVVHRAGKLGLGTAYLDGFRWGIARGYDWLFEMDADLSHDPRFLPAMFKSLESGADVVVGSRGVPGGGVEGWGPLRHAISKGGSCLSRAVLGLGVHDLTSGYKGFTRRALQTIGLDQARSTGFSFQIEMTYRAARAGLCVAEVPILFVDRVAGRSKMSWRIVVEALKILWYLRALRHRAPRLPLGTR